MISSQQTQSVLTRIYDDAEGRDARAKAAMRAVEDDSGSALSARERSAHLREAPLAITADVGRLLYILAGSGRRTVVEFGTSHGASAIFLASGLRDSGGGLLITAELDADKADIARQNLNDAGLADVVDLRVGDAVETFGELPDDVDLVP